MINATRAESLQAIAFFYAEAFRKFDPLRRPPPVEISFYPYIGINHTIRLRDGRAVVRIAEICSEMPMPQQRALAYILVAKLLRRRVPAGAERLYSAFANDPEVRARAAENRRKRGRKIVTSPRGERYDLQEIFADLNRKYFADELETPVLSWSSRKTYRILGHHDSAHKTIILSKSLDSADVPRFVVEYVLYHEMLHIHHPTVHHNGRRYNHTSAFRRDERRFPLFDEAERWIAGNVRKLKRRAKAK